MVRGMNNSTVRTALIAVAAVIVAKIVLPKIPGLQGLASKV